LNSKIQNVPSLITRTNIVLPKLYERIDNLGKNKSILKEMSGKINTQNGFDKVFKHNPSENYKT
jgi:hypothetical protein